MNLLNNTSKLVLTHNFEETLTRIKEQKQENEILYIYPESEILIDDVRNIIKHSYIKNTKNEYIILSIVGINSQAQNAFLKILEEPPPNKYFIFLSKTKNIFLPTILSRLMLVCLQKEAHKVAILDFDILNINLNNIYKFMQKHKNIQKQDAINTLEAIFKQIYENNIFLPKKELESFSDYSKLLNLNSKPIHILSTILLKIQFHLSKKNEYSKTK